MKRLILLFLLSTACCILAAEPNLKQNFCQNNRCLTCVGRYCTTTCQGESCKDCPLGECCNGINCNICRGDICCTTEECNNCINKCLQKCQGSSTCHYDCFQECIPNQFNASRNQGNSKYSLISNINYLPVNVTTIINITNSINSENAIYNPIIVNSTNFNNVTSNRRSSYHRKQVILNGNQNGPPKNFHNLVPLQVNNTGIIQNIIPPQKHNCCEVVHPELCHNAKGQNGILCYTGKHQECSQLCTGKHIHIVENKGENSTCILIATPPYFFCGHYTAENCDGCYNNCSEEETTDCSEEIDCSDTCKISIIDKQFYNKLYRKN